MTYNVLITDYYYPDSNEEIEVFAGLPVNLIDGNGKCSREEDIIKLGRKADAIITQFAPLQKM